MRDVKLKGLVVLFCSLGAIEPAEGKIIRLDVRREDEYM